MNHQEKNIGQKKERPASRPGIPDGTARVSDQSGQRTKDECRQSLPRQVIAQVEERCEKPCLKKDGNQS